MQFGSKRHQTRPSLKAYTQLTLPSRGCYLALKKIFSALKKNSPLLTGTSR